MEGLGLMPTLDQVRQRVREKIRDIDLRSQKRDTVELDNAISEAYLMLHPRIPAARVHIPSAGTIAANADTFLLPTAAGEEYQGEIRIRLRSDGTFLERKTVEEIDLLRSGETSTIGTRRPTCFCMWEEDDMDVQARCWPRSKDAETYDLFCTLSPSDPRDSAFPDAVVIAFSRTGAQSLVLLASALLVGAMSDEDLASVRVDRGIASAWMREADRLIYLEAQRRNNLESVDHTLRFSR